MLYNSRFEMFFEACLQVKADVVNMNCKGDWFEIYSHAVITALVPPILIFSQISLSNAAPCPIIKWSDLKWNFTLKSLFN